MAEIIWTLEAARWLEDIHDYIALDNPAAAHKVVSGIYENKPTRHTTSLAKVAGLGNPLVKPAKVAKIAQ